MSPTALKVDRGKAVLNHFKLLKVIKLDYCEEDNVSTVLSNALAKKLSLHNKGITEETGDQFYPRTFWNFKKCNSIYFH